MKQFQCPYLNQKYCTHKRIIISYPKKSNCRKLCIFKNNPNRCPYYNEVLQVHIKKLKASQELSEEEQKAIGKKPDMKGGGRTYGRPKRKWGRSYVN